MPTSRHAQRLFLGARGGVAGWRRPVPQVRTVRDLGVNGFGVVPMMGAPALPVRGTLQRRLPAVLRR
jgi:hypothetical protein